MPTPSTISDLKDFWTSEILGKGKPFSWLRLLRRASRSNSCNCLFWLRLAQYLDTRPHRFTHSLAKRISKSLARRFGVEIMLGAEIDKGLKMDHPNAIVIYSGVRIGKNCTLRQSTTIGSVEAGNQAIMVGDNVNIGAHTCIIGSNLRIGDNVIIGAMSFINKDVPDNVTYITQKTSTIIPHQPPA
ncbi:Serine acetyltransferase [Halopseudomonas salegens]|uniref:Serine acetyltransferase n=2 Tax=Halopseudomonas salegens TaxID=1434072 RepID=A0A1H2EK08_9GAMM|nr:Serine acetyltransferase [Halopseudomonas salegens]